MRVARPWHWFLLYLPFGVTGGFVGVTLGYIANQSKMSDSTVAGLVAMSLLPHTWKFFWAPIADVTLSYKKWYVLSNLISCATVMVMAFVPFVEGNLGTFRTLIFINAVAITFLGMAVEGLMAHATPESERGRAAGWFQAGNLGGYGVGGGLALMIAESVSTKAAFFTIALIFAACMLALQLVPAVPREHRQGGLGTRVVTSARDVFKDLYKTLASRRGIIALVICSIPLGAGAAAGLFSAGVARDWGASAKLVAMSTGVLGGVVAAVGCLAGGWISDRMRRRVAYVLSGIILAAVATLMALSPQNAVTYAIFTLAYMFATGMVYGCFTGFVLEVIGVGAIATKYNALASLSNIPIWYMTLVLGGVSDDYGAVTMLFVDAGAGMIGLAVLLLAILFVRPHLSKPPAPTVG